MISNDPRRSGSGYSLWLVPQQDAAQTFARLIERLAGRWSGPVFAPHITLVGNVSAPEEAVTNRCQDLASTLGPLTLGVDGIGWEDVYFRSLYLKIAPSARLLEAYHSALRACGRSTPPAYMPHLSLFYGDLPETGKLEMADSLAGLYPTGFRVEHMDLIKSQGPPEDWRRVQRWTLSGRQAAA